MSKIYTTLAILILLSFSLQLYPQEPGLEWVNRMGSSGSDYGISVTVDHIGNIYTVGFFKGTVDFDPGPETHYLTAVSPGALFIQKTDSDGNLIWISKIENHVQGFAGITCDVSGNVYLTGSYVDSVDFEPGPGAYQLTSYGSSDVFVLKLNAVGEFQWASGIGGSDQDHGRSISVDRNGHAYVTGYTIGHVDFNPSPNWDLDLPYFGEEDIFILKLDEWGNYEWCKIMGSISDDRGHSIALDSLGNIYTTGHFSGYTDFDPDLFSAFMINTRGKRDAFVHKLDSKGVFHWARGIGNTENGTAYSITLDDIGNSYSTGYFVDTVDFNPGSGIYELSSNGAGDVYVQKMDKDGNFIWARSFGSNYPEVDIGLSISTDKYRSVYTTGYFWDNCDFDPGPGIFHLSSNGGQDMFIQKIDEDGNFIWARNLGGAGSDVGFWMNVNQSMDIICTGEFSGVADFDPSQEVYDLYSAGGDDIFVLKWSQELTPVEEINFDHLILFPNPTGNNFQIDLGKVYPGTIVDILTVSGQKVSSQNFYNTRNLEVSIEGPVGLYLVNVKNGSDQNRILKVVKGAK